MSWKKKCSYKQLFWKLPREIFSQSPWKISLKKFIFRKVALSRSRKFLLKKETGKKQFLQISLLGKHLRERDWKLQTVSLQFLLKMNFFVVIFQGFWLQISEHLFSRTPLKWLLLQRRIQDLVKMELFCEYNERLKAVKYFHKKAPC